MRGSAGVRTSSGEATLRTRRAAPYHPGFLTLRAAGGARVATLTVEDFELDWASAVSARSPEDLLPELWRLRMSREPELRVVAEST